MNRIPPNLLYLTIYNPTLRPSNNAIVQSANDDETNDSGNGNVTKSTDNGEGNNYANVNDDNEDAEEQAHILFYTSKERAVSRDRMLRQIGLAKALVNFAELFNSADACDNVHSQTKRLIMVSPEPDFWIHAGIELAKIPRPFDPKTKSKSATVKGKPTANKGKDKEKDQNPAYDYDEGSVHDSAVRAHIMRGYERFKLTHGSFSSILSTLGQTALELQLERFWTVWAWSWDLEERIPFGEDLGPLLHPCFASLTPIVNDFAECLSKTEGNGGQGTDDRTKAASLSPVIFTREHIIPSTRYTNYASAYPPALAAHLQSMIPPPGPAVDTSHSSDTLNTLASSVDTIRGKRPTSGPDANVNHATSSDRDPSKQVSGNDGASIFGINMNMDMKNLKWNWPGYLTFGKGNVTKPPLDKSVKTQMESAAGSAVGIEKENMDSSTTPNGEEAEADRIQVEVTADTDALEDAISSDGMSLAARNSPPKADQDIEGNDNGEGPGVLVQEIIDNDDTVGEDDHDHSDTISSTFSKKQEDDDLPSLPEFSLTNLHLAPIRDPTNTRRVTIHYLIRNEFMLALINTQDLERDAQQEDDDDDDADLQIAAGKSSKLFDDLEAAIYEAGLKNVSSSLPSATRILQTQDRYLISTGHYTHSSPGFTSTSSHLFNAKAILDHDSDITEVFSRGQNPQHWHIAKRCVSSTQQTAENEATGEVERVFMEVFRKETSLTDVDNVLAGVHQQKVQVAVWPCRPYMTSRSCRHNPVTFQGASINGATLEGRCNLVCTLHTKTNLF